MRAYFIAICLVCLICPSVTSGQWSWARTATSVKQDWGNGVAVDPWGNVYVIGTFSDEIAFGSTVLNSVGPYPGSDIFLAKWNDQGDLLWALNFGSKQNDEGAGVLADSIGNVYITGTFRDTAYFGTHTLISNGLEDVFLAKLDSSGQIVWTSSYGGPQKEIAGAGVGAGFTWGPGGKLLLSGSFAGTFNFGQTLISASSSRDGFLALIDTSGFESWVLTLHAPSGVLVPSVSYSNGVIFVGGNFAGNSLSIGGNHYWSPNTGFMVGTVFTAKLTPSGNVEWVQLIGGHETLGGTSGGALYGGRTAIGSDGSVYTTGYFLHCELDLGTISFPYASTINTFLAKYTADGTLSWAKLLGGSMAEYIFAITNGPDDKIYFTGTLGDGAYFGQDTISGIIGTEIYVASIDTSGALSTIMFAHGRAASEAAHDMVMKGGEVYLTGRYFSGTLSFGTSVLTPQHNNFDMFVAKASSITHAHPVSEVEASVSLYPNPVTDILNIRSSVPVVHTRLIGIDGRLLLSMERNSVTQIDWQMQDLTPGIYLLEMTLRNGTTLRKRFQKL